jgi:hypothetical protein
MKGSLWTVAVLACALALLVPLGNTAYDGASQEFDATENTTVDYNSDYELEHPDAESYSSLTVTNSSDATLVEGTDYDFDGTNATIAWLNTTSTSSGETVTVAYSYVDHSDAQETSNRVLGLLGPWIGFSLLIAAMGYLVILMVGGSGF